MILYCKMMMNCLCNKLLSVQHNKLEKLLSKCADIVMLIYFIVLFTRRNLSKQPCMSSEHYYEVRSHFTLSFEKKCFY